MTTTLHKILSERVVINENGRKKTITKFEAAMMQLARRAMTGDHQAIKQVIALMSLAEQRAELDTPQEPALGQTEKKMMQNIMKRFARSGERKSDA